MARVFDRRDEGRRHRVKVFIDSGIESADKGFHSHVKAYVEGRSERLQMAGPIDLVPGGAKAKRDWDLLHHVMGRIAESHLCRQSYVLAIGGGSMLDMVGLAASLVHRGVRLVRAPSTVLSQNDAGIGVKTGIDDHGMKNFAGTFTPPFAVLNDFHLLRTLEMEHWIGGVAEAYKVAILKDQRFFRYLQSNAEKLAQRDEAAIQRVIKQCAVLHLEHIGKNGDPFEFGSARPLDFGHWSAHRLEMLSKHRMGHGQAVSVGIALDTCYACRMGMISIEERDSILGALERTGLPVFSDLLEARSADGTPALLKGLDDFREHLGGMLTITLPTAIGRTTEVNEMNPGVIEAAVLHLKDRISRRRSGKGSSH